MVEEFHVVVGGAAGVLFLLHGDAGDGGAGEAVVLQAEVEQLVGEERPGGGGVKDGREVGGDLHRAVGGAPHPHRLPGLRVHDHLQGQVNRCV